MITFAIATEDALSEMVAGTLLHQVGTRNIQVRMRKEGFGYLRSRIADFNRIAEKVMPVLLITDLYRKQCPPEMIVDWLPVPRSPRLLFRIAAREAESWVLADRAAFSRFIGVSVAAMPTAPDELPDQKAALLKLIRKSSKQELKRGWCLICSGRVMIPSKKKKVHQRVHHYTLSTTCFR